MKYRATLLAVSDLERSKRFYCEVLGLCVEADFGANLQLSGGIALQTQKSWLSLICKENDELSFGANAFELYFEEDEIEAFAARLTAWPNVRLLHPLAEQPWAQRAVRFYDPDGHVVEVGESLCATAKRLLAGGLSKDEAARRMDVSPEYFRSLLA